MDVTSDAYTSKIATTWAMTSKAIRSFWHSPVIMAEVRRRITGDSSTTPEAYFKKRYCPKPFPRAISLGSGDGQLEHQLIQLEVCEHIVGVDISHERVHRAREKTPLSMRERVDFVVANLETWRPSYKADLIVVKSILHHIYSLESWCEAFSEILHPWGLVYVDDFIGPTRFQWTDKQLKTINRLLACLPSDLKVDLTLTNGQLKEKIGRPNLERFIAVDPSEAIRSSDIISVLDQYLERVEFKPYGGAIFHILFSRIMGNFNEKEDVVRLILEFEAILMEEGIVGSDFVWAVYRPRMITK